MSKLLRQRVISKAKQEEVVDDVGTDSKNEEGSQLPENDEDGESTFSKSNETIDSKSISQQNIIKKEEVHVVDEKRDVVDDNGSSVPTISIGGSGTLYSSVMNNNNTSSTTLKLNTKKLNDTRKNPTNSNVESNESTCKEFEFGAKKDAIIVEAAHKSPKSKNSTNTGGEKMWKMADKKTLNSVSRKRQSPSNVVSNTAKKRAPANNSKSRSNKSGKAKGRNNAKAKDGDKNNSKLKTEGKSGDQEGKEGAIAEDSLESEDEQQKEISKSKIYDAILAECRGLLHAAHEAQAFGRLKMASTYLLLLHARLIGLGKRFDRSGMPLNPQLRTTKTVTHNPPAIIDSQPAGSTNVSSFQTSASAFPKTSQVTCSSSTVHPISSSIKKEEESISIDIDIVKQSPLKPSPVTETNNSMEAKDPFLEDTMHSSDSLDSTKEAAQALAKCLPSNINLDSTMMEHLAKAAMELHNKRTGKRNASTTNNLRADSSSRLPSGGSVVWTEQEKKDCWKAAEIYGAQNISQIMKAMKTHRTEAQVKAHLRNVVGKTEKMKQFAGGVLTLEEVPSSQIEIENNKTNFSENEKIKSTHGKVKQESNETANLAVTETNKFTDRDINLQSQLQDSDSNKCTSVQGESSNPGNTTKRGGRFKKPPSVAVHTVANASFDARAMLMGKILK